MKVAPAEVQARQLVTQARRVVVKVGSRVLVQRSGRPDGRRLEALTAALEGALRGGSEVVLVSSGAIAAGVEALGLARRPQRLPELQMCAAVGQSRLMAIYARLFGQYKRVVGQVLLTHDGLRQRARHLNARQTLLQLLRRGIVPIINENDAVATDEIRVGDNDVLAALVAVLVQADLLVLLSTTDGLRAPSRGRGTRRVSYLPDVAEEHLRLAVGKGSALSTGGMGTKLEAAGRVARVGIPCVIADGRKPDTLGRILRGESVGTLIAAPMDTQQRLVGRKRWIAFFQRAAGSLWLDAGAAQAVSAGGRSLLPIGISAVEGEFAEGAVVILRGSDGREIGRGLSAYASGDLRRIIGRRTAEIAGLLGRCDYEEAVHRDNLVLASGSVAAPAAPARRKKRSPSGV